MFFTLSSVIYYDFDGAGLKKTLFQKFQFFLYTFRYNLLDSAILELFEFIKLEDIKSLCSHVVENYGKILDDVEYVQTFKTLKTRYDQHQDKLKERDRGMFQASSFNLRYLLI